MKKDVIVNWIILFILIMMFINLCIFVGMFSVSFEIGLFVFSLWFFPLIGILIWFWYFEEY